MGDTQQPQRTGTGATAAEAAAELAEIRRRQERVVKTALVPVWYWWAIAAAIVVIGAARDSGDPVVQAITIPLAALVIAGLTAATIPGVRRRVRLYGAMQPGGRGVIAIFALIVLVDGATVGTAASLQAAGVRYPVTIGCAAGAAMIVIAGPLVNRYLCGLMLTQARQRMSDAPGARGSTP